MKLIPVLPPGTSLKEIHERRKWLWKENRKFPAKPIQVAREAWPEGFLKLNKVPIEVWRSEGFLIQIFEEAEGLRRLSVCRTNIRDDGNFDDRITWDELQDIKNQVGYLEFDAVEIYPREADRIYVANMRHLWLFQQPISFAWRAQPQPKPAEEPCPTSPTTPSTSEETTPIVPTGEPSLPPASDSSS